MNRVFNFSAGPATLPLPVLQKAQEEFPSYQNTGFSIIEMSHRSKHFEEILFKTEQLFRKLMNIPSNYKVLFLQGGASLQFSMVPLNLLQNNRHAYYVHTGNWSEKAIVEAKKVGNVTVIRSSEENQFLSIPSIHLTFDATADYVHITTNNTIEGTRYDSIPETNNIPLVADMSSNILSEVYDVSKFGLIYAGAQKNIGPAGVTIVIIRDDLFGQTKPDCPTMLNYNTYAKSNSLYNTPPTFSIYMTMLVLEWLEELGGVETIEAINREKANILYSFLDHSSLFHTKVEKPNRSLMNIPFTTNDAELDQLFIENAYENRLYELQGHRLTGGMRASIYNAMPIEGVKKLVQFMKEFESIHR